MITVFDIRKKMYDLIVCEFHIGTYNFREYAVVSVLYNEFPSVKQSVIRLCFRQVFSNFILNHADEEMLGGCL